MRFSLIKYCVHMATPLAMIFAFYFFLRGHNQPGGGFIAGLVVAIAFVLYAIAFDIHRARRLLPMSFERLFSLGLGLAALTGVAAIVTGRPFLTSGHVDVSVGYLGDYHLVSSFLFDLGVFLVVIAAVAGLVFQFAERRCELYWPEASGERPRYEDMPLSFLLQPVLAILRDPRETPADRDNQASTAATTDADASHRDDDDAPGNTEEVRP